MKNDIIIRTKQLLEKNGLIKPSPYSEFEWIENGIEIDVTIKVSISKIDNLIEVLLKLEEDSETPIYDDGYTGLESYSDSVSGVNYFKLSDTENLFAKINNENYFCTYLLKNNINKDKVENLLITLNKLDKLGFDIVLYSCSFEREEYEKEKKLIQKRIEEDKEEHYSISDYPMINEED